MQDSGNTPATSGRYRLECASTSRAATSDADDVITLHWAAPQSGRKTAPRTHEMRTYRRIRRAANPFRSRWPYRELGADRTPAGTRSRPGIPGSGSPYPMFFSASRRDNGERRSPRAETKRLTSAGSVRAYCRSAQPMALRIKKSRSSRLASMHA